MSFEERIAGIERNRRDTNIDIDTDTDTAARSTPKRETGLGTILLWALFLGLVWGAVAFPLGAVLAFAILGPSGAIVLIPYLLLRRRRQRSPERQAVLDLLGYLNPFA